MTMHTCVATVHTSLEVTTRRGGYVQLRERQLPFMSRRAAAPVRGWCAPLRVCGRAVRSRGRAGRACWLPVTSRRHESGCSMCCEHTRPLRTFGVHNVVLYPQCADARVRFCARGVGAWGLAAVGRPMGQLGLYAACCVLCAAVFCRTMGVVLCRVVLCVLWRAGRARCRVRCRVLACGGGVSRACRVLSACVALRRR